MQLSRLVLAESLVLLIRLLPGCLVLSFLKFEIPLMQDGTYLSRNFATLEFPVRELTAV